MLGQIFRNMPDVVKNLLIINLLMFLATFLFSSPGSSLVFDLGLYYWGSDQFEPYQIVTHMFMHGGFMHIFFNMFALVMFGSQLERVWGAQRFLIFYLVTGLGAAALHLVVAHFEAQAVLDAIDYPITLNTTGTDVIIQGKSDLATYINSEGLEMIRNGRNFTGDLGRAVEVYTIPTVGASGAIYGLLLGFAMLFPNTELMLLFFPIPIKAKYFMPILMGIELFMGVQNFSGDNIAHFAHLGGALFGFILVKIWQKDRNNFY